MAMNSTERNKLKSVASVWPFRATNNAPAMPAKKLLIAKAWTL